MIHQNPPLKEWVIHLSVAWPIRSLLMPAGTNERRGSQAGCNPLSHNSLLTLPLTDSRTVHSHQTQITPRRPDFGELWLVNDPWHGPLIGWCWQPTQTRIAPWRPIEADDGMKEILQIRNQKYWLRSFMLEKIII